MGRSTNNTLNFLGGTYRFDFGSTFFLPSTMKKNRPTPSLPTLPSATTTPNGMSLRAKRDAHPGVPDKPAPRRKNGEVAAEKQAQKAAKAAEKARLTQARKDAAALEDRMATEDIAEDASANHPPPTLAKKVLRPRAVASYQVKGQSGVDTLDHELTNSKDTLADVDPMPPGNLSDGVPSSEDFQPDQDGKDTEVMQLDDSDHDELVEGTKKSRRVENQLAVRGAIANERQVANTWINSGGDIKRKASLSSLAGKE